MNLMAVWPASHNSSSHIVHRTAVLIMAVRVSSSPTLSRPFVELFWKMLDFSTKWPTKFAGKVSKCRHNENCCEGRGPGIIFEHFVRALLQAYCNSGGAKYELISI